MKLWPALAAALALAACGQSEEPDECELARENLDQCLLVNRAATALETINKCVPVSDLQRFDGTWAYDRDLNAFYEGEVREPEAARNPPPGTVQLIYEGSTLEEYVVGELATVAQVGFYGRRPVCGFEERFPYLLVERVASRSIIEQYRSPLFPQQPDAPRNQGHADPFDQQGTVP